MRLLEQATFALKERSVGKQARVSRHSPGLAREDLHGAVSVILDRLDLDLSSAHRGDAPSLWKIGRFYELIQLLCGEETPNDRKETAC